MPLGRYKRPCFSKWGPNTTAIAIFWNMVEIQNLRPWARPMKSEFEF